MVAPVQYLQEGVKILSINYFCLETVHGDLNIRIWEVTVRIFSEFLKAMSDFCGYGNNTLCYSVKLVTIRVFAFSD